MKRMPPEPEPESFETPELPPPRPRFAGSHVPVTKVHVDRQKRLSTVRTPVPEAKKEAVTGPARPLFAKPIPTASGSKATPMRVGQKERLWIAALFALILIAVVIAGLVFLPSSKIDLTLRTAPLLVDERFVLSTQSTGEANVLPGSGFSREVEVTGSAPVTSREVIGTKTTGSVEIVNRTTDEQKIRERSRLETKDGVLFYMIGHAIVPPAEGGVPSRATVQVEAAEAGPQGNIAPQRLNFVALDASAQSLVYAENVQALTGGSGSEVAVIKEADMEAARQAAGQSGRAQAEQEIRAELPKGWAMLEESWQSEIKSFDTPVKLGAQQDTIPYTGRVLVHVLGYEDAKLQDALMKALNAKLDQDFMLFPGKIAFTSAVESTDWEKGEATIGVRITHMTVPNFSVETLRDKLKGRDTEEAIKYLQGLKGVQKATVETWPFWVNSIPTIDKRVSIELHSEN
jgi:hypothetical protein